MPKYINPENIKLNSLSWVDGGEDILVPLIDVRKAIAQTPSEDVVAVVRCRECGSCYNNPALGTFRCGRFMAIVNPNDFCSYGERKENESSID